MYCVLAKILRPFSNDNSWIILLLLSKLYPTKYNIRKTKPQYRKKSFLYNGELQNVFSFFRTTSTLDITYLQQVSLILLSISMCFFFAMVFYGMPQFNFYDNFSRYGDFDFHPEIFTRALFTILVTFPIYFGILFLFRYLFIIVKRII